MLKQLASAASLFLLAFLPGYQPTAAPVSDAPTYTKEGDLNFPANYREWVYLTSGIDMSYTATGTTEHMAGQDDVHPRESRRGEPHLHQQARPYPGRGDYGYGDSREGRRQVELLRPPRQREGR